MNYRKYSVDGYEKLVCSCGFTDFTCKGIKHNCTTELPDDEVTQTYFSIFKNQPKPKKKLTEDKQLQLLANKFNGEII